MDYIKYGGFTVPMPKYEIIDTVTAQNTITITFKIYNYEKVRAN